MSVGIRKMASAVLLPVMAALKHKGLLKGFAGREIRGRFAGNIGGMLWALVNPLVTMLVYMFVFSVVLRVRITAAETGTDSFFIYFVAGFVPWIIFADSLSRATGCLLDNASLITRVIFPVELIPATTVISACLINGLGFVIMLIYLAVQGYADLTWLFLPLVMVLQFFFAWGAAMLISSACVYIRDLREITGLLLMVWFFSTPVIYPLSMVPEGIRTIIELNPMYLFVTLYRSLMIQHTPEPGMFLAVFLVSALAYAAGSLFFAKLKPGFGDVL